MLQALAGLFGLEEKDGFFSGKESKQKRIPANASRSIVGAHSVKSGGSVHSCGSVCLNVPATLGGNFKYFIKKLSMCIFKLGISAFHHYFCRLHALFEIVNLEIMA
jgi:hypothetical protein